MGRELENNEADNMEIDGSGAVQQPTNQLLDGFNANYLRIYYGKFFPYADMYKWMAYGNDGKHPGCDQSYVGRREFSFTLEDDIYLRFQSFNNVTEFEKAVKEKCPFKIDIGPVYSVDPAKRSAYAQSVFIPVERELVFDIDISDYDDVRYCCSGADVCSECWPLMTVAIRVIHTSLTDDFGFEHILWVYSGRRGVHCWVCDARARRLTNEQRSAVAEYLHFRKTENNQKKFTQSNPFHPHFTRSYTDVLKDFFDKTFVSSQEIFSHEERYEKILEMIPDDSITSTFRRKWKDNRRSSNDINIDRWADLQKVKGIHRCVEEIVFHFTYPRLDLEVSKHTNHLLKAPFCIHPKTGRVCVPIDPNQCEQFDPSAVPTLSKLMEELNMGTLGTSSSDAMENSSLGESIRYFRSFLQPLLEDCKKDNEKNYAAKAQQRARNSIEF